MEERRVKSVTTQLAENQSTLFATDFLSLHFALLIHIITPGPLIPSELGGVSSKVLGKQSSNFLSPSSLFLILIISAENARFLSSST